MKKQKWRIIFLMVFFAWLCSGCVPSQPGPKPQSEQKNQIGFKDVARQLIKDLDQQFPLSNQSIQVVGENFNDRDSKTILPFSNVLSDALAPLLNDLNADVSVQEIGTTPLKLVGSYSKNEKSNLLMVTLRLRAMGDEAGRDIASAQREMQLRPEQAKWFRFSYENSAQTMIKSLIDNYTDGQSIFIGKIELEPRDKQLPIKFANSFIPSLHSAIIGESSSGPIDYTGNGSSWLKGVYTVSQEQRSVFLELAFDIIGPDGKTLTSSRVFRIDSKYIPFSDWTPVSTFIVMPSSVDPGPRPAVEAATQGVADYLSGRQLRVQQAPSHISDFDLKENNIRVAIEVKLKELTEGSNADVVVVDATAVMRDTYTGTNLGVSQRTQPWNLPNDKIRETVLIRAANKAGKKVSRALYGRLIPEVQSNKP